MGRKLTPTNCKPGDLVVCIDNTGITSNGTQLIVGEKYILSKGVHCSNTDPLLRVNLASGKGDGWYAKRFELVNNSITESVTKTMKNIVTNAKSEVTEFIETNKNLLYWVAILVVVDQFFLEGKFREKLKEIFESLLTKVKAKLDDIHI